jgi:hypothetical protein
VNEIRDAEPPPQPRLLPRRNAGGRNDHYWWALALIPGFWSVLHFFGVIALIVTLVVIAAVAIAHVVLTRRGLDGEKIVGGIIGALGGLAAVVTMLNVSFPSSVMWMSAIVCRSAYRLEYDVSHYSYRPGESSSTVDYACVSGENVYDVNDFTVWGLQALGIAVVLCPWVVIGFLIWRRVRRC